MCNCNNKRSSLNNRSNSTFEKVDRKAQESIKKIDSAMFKYIGNTGLTVIGNVTKKRYRFNFHGDVQLVSQADVAGMNSVPVLHSVS